MDGKAVKVHKEEYEHIMLNRFVHQDATVLEVGARYGTSTCALSRVLHNSEKQVCVEADEDVWASLEGNLKRNDCKAHIFKGAVGTTVKKKDKCGMAVNGPRTSVTVAPGAAACRRFP